MSGPYKIILADDHAIVREAVKSSLEKHPGLEVIGEAQDGLGLLDLLKKLTPDLIILDISMPTLPGLEAVQEIKQLRPRVKILILTMHKSGEYLYQAITAGVNGYLLKENVFADLLDAIQAIRGGGTYISPLIAGELHYVLAEKKARSAFAGTLLSPREMAVLRLLAEGKSSKEIAGLLFISSATVNTHRHNLKKKLKCKTNAELIRFAIQSSIQA